MSEIKSSDLPVVFLRCEQLSFSFNQSLIDDHESSLPMRLPRTRKFAYALAFASPLVIAALGPLGISPLGIEARLGLLLLPLAVTACLGGFWPGVTATLWGWWLSVLVWVWPFQNSASLSLLFSSWWAQALFIAQGLVLSGLFELNRRSRLQLRAERDDYQGREVHLHRLINSVKNYGISMINLDRTFGSWNVGVLQVLGYSQEEFLGLPIASIYTPEDVGAGVPEFELYQAATEGHCPDFRWHVKKDGTRFWAMGTVHPLRDQEGKLLGYVKVLGDYTDQKKLEMALSDADERMRSVLQTITSGIISISEDGVIQKINPAVAGIFGYESVELLEKSVDIMLAEPKQGAQDSSIMHFLHHSLPIVLSQGREFEGKRKDGSTFPLHLAIGAYNQGARRMFTGVIHDITVQKETETKLRRAKEDAEKASQTKSHFLANMSHEIRTPLGAILGFTELLLASGTSDQDRVKYLSTIKRNGQVLGRIIDDILDLSRVEAGRLSIETIVVNLPHLIMDLKQLLDATVQEKGLVLQVSTQGPIPELVLTDPTRLRQILFNLLGNAIKFTENGSVHLTISSAPQDVSKLDRQRIEFLVKDTGRGIEEKHQDSLFQPFSQGDSTTARRFGGSGLGLILSRRLAQLLGGDVELVSSQAGVGSVFRARISMQLVAHTRWVEDFQWQPPPIPLEDERVTEETLKGLRVLVVDDAIDNQRLIARFLDAYGAVVQVASNGREGLDRALKESFDLLLMDMEMPVMDGYEATRTLRARGYDKPILALTAHAMKEERDRSLRAGFSDYLTKPIVFKELIQTLKHYMPPSSPDQERQRT